jgi:hypothetical protein
VFFRGPADIRYVQAATLIEAMDAEMIGAKELHSEQSVSFGPQR